MDIYRVDKRISQVMKQGCAGSAGSLRLKEAELEALDQLSPLVRRRAFSSSAVDLAARRGVFSRRHYGSVELLTTCDRDGCTSGRFRVEDGERDEMSNLATGTDVHLENPEYQTRWYFKYFLGKIHQNYVGLDMDKRIVFLSVVLTDANNHNVPQYRSILWRTTGTQKICIPYNPAKPMSVKRILSRFDIKMEKSPKEIFTPEIQKELLLLEEQEGSVNFKFGVLYAKEGQKSDDEMFSNEDGSGEFYNFVKLLGDRIKLKNWDKFNGGLDVKNNTTGLEAVYTMYEGHEIMFHVSTMLPYSKDNRQQVERKRHIGNDIVTIVFQEQDDPEAEPTFKPSMIKSHFTHIFALVTFNRSSNSYRLRVFSEESVPLFGPPLPSPSIFDDPQAFRDFLLVKLINGEKAAFNTPTFSNKRQRTLEMLIKNLQQDLPETNKNMLNKRSLSDVIPEPVWGWRSKKEEARQVEFVRVGQLLKLKTIVKGDAPTSLATTSLLKREPWEPQCIHNDFAHEVQCGDSWGDRLIVGTEVGIFCIEEGLPPRMLFDRTVSVKQLSVVEAHDLLIFRADKGKESRVYVFRLTDFEGEPNELVVRTKNDCKDHKLERTKGCQLYALSRPGGSHLRMVVAVAKKLLVMAWKHSAAWTAWCGAADTDPVEGFTFVRELVASEVPTLMTLVDGGKEDNQICVAFRNQFDLVNEKNGDTFRLHLVETSKQVNLVSTLDIYEDEEPELLLSYNHVSQFKKLSGENSSDFDIHWNSAPKAIVCAFPYILAFTHDSVEIRLVVNGNLVHTMTMPRLNLISSKCDLHFTSTGTPDLLHGLQPSPKDPVRPFSPLASPTNPNAIAPLMGSPTRIFKIPLISLVGQMTERAVPPTNNRPRSFISPLVNIAETSPGGASKTNASGLTTRPQSDTALSQYEKNLANDSGNAEGLTPWRNTYQLPRPSAEYSDSGYSESDVSFESTECTDVPRGYPYDPQRAGQDSSAEMRRKMFSCLHSPRQHRRTVSSQSADPEARAELLGTSKSKPGTRSRFGSNHSDSVFYSNSRMDSRSSSVASESDSSRSDTTVQSWPRSPRFSSSGSTASQSEAEMRAELLGKLLRSPKLGRPSTSSTMSTQSDSEDRGSVFESTSPVRDKTSLPFYLSSSVDEEDIDLK